jgi:gas vesicle protein
VPEIQVQEVEMSRKEGVSAGMIVLATFIGGILGTAAGFLLAPQSGKRTQEKIRETYGIAAESVNSTLKKVDGKVSEVIAKVTSEVKEVPVQVKSEVIKMTREAEDTLNRTVEKGTSYIMDVAGTVATSLQEGKKKFIEKKEQFIVNK